MDNSLQSLQPDQHINVITLAQQPQLLPSVHIMQDIESSFYPSTASTDGNHQPDGNNTSPIFVNVDRPSADLLPGLQLPISTVSCSDFLSASDGSDSSLSQDHDIKIKTPSLYTGLVLGDWAPTSGPEYEEVKQIYQKAAMPRVLEASKRLQQVMGVRNDNEFKPPTPRMRLGGIFPMGNAVSSNPALRHLRDPTAHLGVQIQNAGHGRVQAGSEASEGTVEIEKLLRASEVVRPGLRESLLMHGRQPYGNQARSELKSISFHELTPDLRPDMGFKSELLAHFEADVDFRTRLICYEISVPALSPPHPPKISTGPSSKPQLPQTDRWLALLISTPLLTFQHDSIPAVPGNFPSEIPTSWVMLGAPCSKIYSYSPIKEKILDRSLCGSKILREVKRFDYDFSHDGVPAFEFMNKSLALGTLGTHLDRAIGGPFLSAKYPPDYEPGNDMVNKPPGYGIDENGEMEDEADLIQMDLDRWEDEENMGPELANSKWWEEVGRKFDNDRNTWARIRDAMGRGRCRVILRHDESLEEKMGGLKTQVSTGIEEDEWMAPDPTGIDPEMRKLPGLAQTVAAAQAPCAARRMRRRW